MPLDFHREALTMACIALEERQCLPTVALLKTALVQSAAPLPPLSLPRTVPLALNPSAARPFGSLSASDRPAHMPSMGTLRRAILGDLPGAPTRSDFDDDRSNFSVRAYGTP